ncbi:hypothetical protein Tco_0949705, partial [Tanacetum coccineum]
VTSATKDVKHAVAIASSQKNRGSLEAKSIVRAASTRVRFRLSTTPFYSGVRGRKLRRESLRCHIPMLSLVIWALAMTTDLEFDEVVS